MFLLFVLAGLSDAVDGFIAKHFELRSELGACLDPLANKALLIARPMAIRPLLISKANTTAQIACGVRHRHARRRHGAGHGFVVALWVVAALTVASAGAYLAQWLDHMSG